MSLLSRIQSWLQPQRNHSRRAEKPHKPHFAAPTPQPNEAASLPPKQSASPAPKKLDKAETEPVPVAPRVHLTIHYRLAHSNKELQPATILRGAIGQPVHLNWQPLPGYVMTEISGFTDTFPAQNASIDCIYEARTAAPVIVYHRDAQGHLLVPPEILTGLINAPFEAHALADSSAAVIGSATQSGQFMASSQTIHFSYELNQLQHASAPESVFIELLATKDAYLDPTADQPLPQPLPIYSYWQVFALVREQPNGTVWLNLGGSQWITASQTRAQETNPFLPAPAPLALPHVQYTQTITPLTAQGRSVAGQTGATLWDKPYGRTARRRLHPAETVSITHRIDLDDGTRWYELTSGLYVLATYVQLNV